MVFEGFIGQSYTSASAPSVDCERSLNVFPEAITAPGVTAKSRLVLRRKPGLSLQQTLGDSPGRGAFAINGRAFCVAGSSFYELLSPTTFVKRGSIPAGTSAVQMAANGVQICLIADGLGFIFTLATNAFTQITSTGFPPATSLTSLDTYFIVLKQNSNQFLISSPLDGLTWSALNFGSSQEPDNAVAIAQSHLYLWIFGQNETIIFQDTGAASFPFQRLGGSQIEQGCAAALSVATLDNTLFWLGADSRGAGIVYRADGLLPTRVSTHAVEEAIQGYSTISDAVASTYQKAGHLFYCLHFPTAGACWVYDVSAAMWHERAYWNASTGTYSAPLERFLMYCFGKHLALDYSSGNVYHLSLNNTDDAGAPIRWLRASPHLSDEESWLFYSSFQLDMQVGDGLASGADPQVMIRWSDDGGRTWSAYRQASCGAVGAYTRRVKINRCGRSRNRVWEVSGTDPIPNLALIAAYLGIEKGVN